MDNYIVKVGTHESCGGTVASAQFPSGPSRYCTKCGVFGADNLPLSSPMQKLCLIAVSYGNQFTVSADCEVLDPSDGNECLDAIMRARKLLPIVDEVLVIIGGEVAWHHGGQEGFRQKTPKKVA